MKLSDLEKRVDELIKKGKVVYNSKEPNRGGFEKIKISAFLGFKTAAESFIMNIYSTTHPFYTQIGRLRQYDSPSTTSNVLSILASIKEEIAGGWLFTTKGLVSAEIFADFMDMAEHLLEENYKDPAAVMIGSVIEEHLRQLCMKNGIDVEIEKNGKHIPKKAELLNSEIAKNNIYTKLDQKNITALLDLRNKAAHGKYSEYTKEQVNLMYHQALDFMVRNPI